jgi:hypothetical protein
VGFRNSLLPFYEVTKGMEKLTVDLGGTGLGW